MALPRFSLKHATSRVLALFFALLVYAHVYTEQERTADFTLSMRLQNLPHNLVLLSEPPPDVRLTLRGTGKQLVKMRVQPPEVMLDLSQARPGEIQRIISPADVLLPPGAGVIVEAIQSPQVVTLDVDTLIARSLPVTVEMVGNLDRGLSLQGTVAPDPDQVLVQGPQGVVTHITGISTEPLDLSSIKGSVSRSLPVRHDSTVTVHPNEVSVSLITIPTEAKILVLTVEARGAAGRSIRILPDTATIHLEGPVDALEQTTASVVTCWVDVADLPLGLHRMAPRVSLPFDNIEVRAVVPSELLVDLGS